MGASEDDGSDTGGESDASAEPGSDATTGSQDGETGEESSGGAESTGAGDESSSDAGDECAGSDVMCGDGCVDTDTDPQHCGGCDNACAADLTCVAGDCVLVCADGLLDCDGTCVDPQSDALYCGAVAGCTGDDAGVACEASQVCEAGGCVGWEDPELIGMTAGQSAWDPRIAMNADGDAIAVWYTQGGKTADDIWANRYDADSGDWDAAELLETDNAEPARRPYVALNGDGDGVAVWMHFNGTAFDVRANHYDNAAASWGGDLIIETDPTGQAWYPRVQLGDGGEAISVWEVRPAVGSYNIRGNSFDGSDWGEDLAVEIDDAGNALGPQVAMDGAGNCIAVWKQWDGAEFSAWANRYDASAGLWGTARLIESDDTGAANGVQVAMDASGNAIAVWTVFDGAVSHVMANRYFAAAPNWASAWGNERLLEDDDTHTANFPMIGVTPGGDAVVVWQQDDGTRDNIVASRYDRTDPWNSAWSDPEEIDGEDGDASFPQIAIGSDYAVVVWAQRGDTFDDIWATTGDTDGWNAPVLLETDDTGHARQPQVAADANGYAIAVWGQSDGTDYAVHAARLVR